MSAVDRQLVGREAELEAIVRLLDDRAELPATAIVHGAAGIGKTTLWLAGVDRARASGYRVMSSRPSEAETRFSYAGVTDLLGRAVDDVLPRLPPVQQRALEAALLIGQVELRLDDRAIAAAFVGAIRLLAEDAPVCLAVDDVQWLDAASLGALRFALARIDCEPVATLLAIRGEPPEWLRRASPEWARRTIHVRGLSVGALRELLRVRLDVAFPRPTLLRLWETSGGNPFFALELASALLRRGETSRPARRSRSLAHSTSCCRRASTVSAPPHSRLRVSSRRLRTRRSGSSNPPSGAGRTPASQRRSLHELSSSTAGTSGSPTHSSDRRLQHVRRRDVVVRCIPSSLDSSRPGRSVLVISRSQPPRRATRSPRRSRRRPARRRLAALRWQRPSWPRRR